MITIYEDFSEANSYQLGNQLHLQSKGKQKLIIAVGNESNWDSKEPLPSDVISIDLIQASINETEKAEMYWSSFLLYLIEESKMRKPRLWNLGFGKIQLKVELNDTATKNLVIKSIKNSRLRKNIDFF